MSDTTSTATAAVVTPNKSMALKTAKRAKAKPDLTTKGVKAVVTTKARGRVSTRESMTPTELRESIKELLRDLADSTDAEEKKNIRRKLRLRGHVGGLGKTEAKS
jgi:Ni,Fe-hydrogenase III large subunit